MTLTEIFVLFFGYLSLGALIIFGITALMIYNNIRERVFIWYATYCIFLALYISFKLIHPVYPLPVIRGFNWYIQTLFYCAYCFFSIYFINLSQYRPRYTKILKSSLNVMIVVSTIIFILSFMIPFKFFGYFQFVFLPYLLLISTISIVIAWKFNDDSKKYFLLGTCIYITLAMLAFILSIYGDKNRLIEPLTYFFLAIIIESFIFSYGLAMRIKKTYTQKIEIQNDLNNTQRLLSEQLEEKIIQQKEINEYLNSKAKTQKLALKVSELNMTLLRSQMNSHFVFNVLNSIKLFVMEKDTERATQYLSKFAKFMRKILDSSFYEHSTLEEEIKTIELYLSIEAMRYDYNFNYKIIIPTGMSLAIYKFPALILQPFVENAIWHGFTLMEGERNLLIEVFPDRRIYIEDNGIGRKNAQERNDKAITKKSYGLSIVKERLKYYNKNANTQIQFEIIDLPIGTRVVIYF